MEEAIVFKRENFNIAKDIRLEADVAYIQGHPIVKTKTVVLYYRGVVFRANEYGKAFTNSLIMHITRPQYTVELINYLSRIINCDNLFEIYVNNRNVEKYSLEELTFANHENDNQGGPTLVDKSEYSEGLLDDHEQFILKELLRTMNSRFSRTFSSIEELDYIPVYGYISASGKVDGNWKAEPVLHLAIVFNVLAHQDRFSGINNQEAIASFNTIMRSKRLNTTAESLNIHEYKNEIKRLQLELQRERERANGLEVAKKTLEEKLDEVNTKLDASAQREQHLINEVHQANAQLQASAQREQQLIDESHQAQAERQQLINQNTQLQTTVQNLHNVVIESGQILHDEFQAAKDEFRERFNQLNVTTSSRIETIDVWRIQRLDDYYHGHHLCTENESVLDTFCGDASKPNRINQHRFRPQETDELIGSYPNANAIDLAVYLRRHHELYPHVRMDSSRKLIYSDEAMDEVHNLLIAYSQTRETIVTTVNRMNERYQDASDTLIARLQTVLHPIAQAQNQIIANQQAQAAQINAQQQAINHLADEVHELRVSFVEFQQRKPRCHQILHRSRYRNIEADENGNAYCEDSKNGPRYYLTEHDLMRGRFR